MHTSMFLIHTLTSSSFVLHTRVRVHPHSHPPAHEEVYGPKAIPHAHTFMRFCKVSWRMKGNWIVTHWHSSNRLDIGALFEVGVGMLVKLGSLLLILSAGDMDR